MKQFVPVKQGRGACVTCQDQDEQVSKYHRARYESWFGSLHVKGGLPAVLSGVVAKSNVVIHHDCVHLAVVERTAYADERSAQRVQQALRRATLCMHRAKEAVATRPWTEVQNLQHSHQTAMFYTGSSSDRTRFHELRN